MINHIKDKTNIVRDQADTLRHMVYTLADKVETDNHFSIPSTSVRLREIKDIEFHIRQLKKYIKEMENV